MAIKNEYIKRPLLSPSFDINENPYYINLYTGILGYVDTKKRVTRPLFFLGMNERGYSQYIDTFRYNNKFYCLQGLSEKRPHIRVLDEIGGSRDIVLNDYPIADKMKKEAYFSSWIRIENYAFGLGYAYPAVVRLNLETEEVSYISESIAEIGAELKFSDGLGYFSSVQSFYKDGILYMPLSCINGVLKLDCNTLEEKIEFYDVDSVGFSCIVGMDDDRCLLTGAGKNPNWLYICDIRNQIVEASIRLQDAPNALSVKNMLVAGETVYLFPWTNWNEYNLDIWTFDTNTHEVNNTFLLGSHYCCEKKKWLFGYEIVYAGVKDENTFLYVTGKDLLWHEFNVKNGEYIEYAVVLDDKDEESEKITKEYYRSLSNNRLPIKEAELGLNDYLDIV